MLLLGPLGFAAPWLLGALIALPVLWVILRAMPPAPRRVIFPGVALLAGLVDRAPIASRTPWWLLLIRLAAVAAAILAFAGPVWRPVVQPATDGPLLIVMDAGFAAAPDWAARQTRVETALTDAATTGRPAALLMADGRGQGALAFQPADALLSALRAAQPQPWSTRLPDDPGAALADAPEGSLSTLWIADGNDYPNRAAWLAALADLGPVTVVPPARPLRTLALAAGDTPSLTLTSVDDAAPAIQAIGPDPQGIERALASLTPGDATDADGLTVRPVAIDLPPELRNRITRFQIEAETHAGAVVLADDRVRRRKVALVGDPLAEGQQLLAQTHYLRQALAPTTDLVEGALGDVLDTAPDVIVLADQVQLAETLDLTQWVAEGGLLIRFAGPRMAGYDRLAEEPLLPVALRQGGRDIGGALSWGDPRGLAPFPDDGPFARLPVPDDVSIRAQLMAQPAPDLAGRTIASLSDNTPLITRDRLGQGQVVLVHVTANAEWSNLPLSGLFPQMMERLVATARLSPSEAATEDLTQPFWTPEAVLDGFGRLAEAQGLTPVPAADLAQGTGPDRPAGIYAAGERRRALNAGGPFVRGDLARRHGRGRRRHAGTRPEGRAAGRGGAAAGAGCHWVGLAGARTQAGGHGGGRACLGDAAGTAGAGAGPGPRSDAGRGRRGAGLCRDGRRADRSGFRTGSDRAVAGAAQPHLGRAGTADRDRFGPGRPVAADVPVLAHHRCTAHARTTGLSAAERLSAVGGMILFDTRDGDIAGVGGPDMSQALRRLAAPLDIPPLAPIPDDHVLTRTFYLLGDFPGRWQGNPVWAEAPTVTSQAEAGVPFRQLNDGVSPVIIGGNSWAEAWAVNADGYAAYPIGQGWEGDRQREMAARFGVNLVMYVLTGNYKSDQVHVPALLDRLRTEEILAP